ncbi:PAS domain-containing sensor histidine kinase [Lentiprolixibacter aurantiacus]|uniref:histidine kinase n=1 Tax=Lentiprolixibacter aurantiacus TaxID=2993939 RepID=A0AAE3SN30_9FLAO|nr:PAS domain S-box protein [Lentiprolixibacter aurantiacus]MCX2719292.1 PAS domain S-box protein [Lentiprolixibacter aurantiacus]
MLRGTQDSLANSLIKQLPIATAFINSKLEVVHASDRWISDFDFQDKMVVGKNLFQLFPDIRNSWKKDLRKVITRGTNITGIECFLDQNGDEHWFNWTNSPWYDQNRKIIGVIIQTEDITNEIFDSAKMEKLEILLNDKSEISRIGSWQYDAVRKDLTWCEITREIHEVPADYTPNIETAISFYKEGYSRNTIAMAVDQAMNEGKPWNEKLQLVTAKGNEIWVIAAGKPIFKDDKFLGLIGTFQDVTKDIISQRKNEEQERQFQSIFNSSYQFTGILDLDGTFLQINETALNFAEIKESDVVGKKFWDAYWWPIPDMVRDGLKNVVKAAAGGEVIRSEIVVLDKNQEKVPVDFSLKPIFDKKKQVTSLLAEGRMIKEMVVAREKLKVSEKKFRALFELSPIAKILSDFDTGEILEINSAFTEVLGIDKEEAASLNYTNIVPNTRSLKRNQIKEILEKEGTFGPLEHELVRKNGVSFKASLSGSLVEIKNGKRLLWTAAQDLTEVKRKEKQINEERQLLRTLIDNLPLNVYIKDLDSKKLLVNKAEMDYCGIKEHADIIGRSDSDFYDDTSVKISREEDLKVMSTLTPILGKETINIKKDGRLTTFLTSKIPLIGDDGKAKGLIGISMDISDLKRKEKELQDLISVTSVQNKQLINFAHIVSHNLRSHSANFSMLLEFLVNETDESEKEKLVKMLTEASDNLLETLDNLNEVVAISTNVNLKKKPVNLVKKIAAVEQNLAAFLKKNNAQILNEIPHDTQVKVVPAYLDSVLMNFITNAVKYKDPQRDPVVKLSLEQCNDYTVLSITDNGLGIDLEKYGDKLFGMYKTFHENPDARGIGLYITKNQVEAMNGKITVSSEPGKGTTFNIHFNEKN